MGIREQAASIAPELAPLVPGPFAREEVGAGAVGAPVQVATEDDGIAGLAFGRRIRQLPVVFAAVEQGRGGVPHDDVALKEEAGVTFRAAAMDLGLAAEGEDVVPDPVVESIVLMEAGVAGVVHEVVFHPHVGAALVGVEPPAAVPVAGHVVDVIAGDAGAGRHAEGV